MTWADIIAAFALIVSIASAYFAYSSPRRAEKLRTKAAQQDREMQIFTILMAERGRWGSNAMLTALNATKIVFRDSQAVLDKWFVCHSKAGDPNRSADDYYDLLAEIGKRVGLPMRREDLENFFVNPVEQKEFAVRSAQAHSAFEALSANNAPSVFKA